MDGLEHARELLVGAALDDADRAALGLLLEHRDGYWLRRGGCVQIARAERRVEWQACAESLASESVATSDRAVLATALHIVGQVGGDKPLGYWWRHLDRLALASVLRAIAVAAGARAQVSDLGDAPLFARPTGPQAPTDPGGSTP